MQRLYDRYDLLCDACLNIRWAMEALNEFKDLTQSDHLAALEEIGGALARDRDATHAALERLEALERGD